MSLTPLDLESINSLLAALEIRLDSRSERRLDQQTKEIAEVINDALLSVDERVTKLEKEVRVLKSHFTH